MRFWPDRATRARRGAIVAAAALTVTIAAVAAADHGSATTASATRSAGTHATAPRSASIEDRFGIRVIGAYLTAADGMIEIQYQVLDHDKALGISDAKPVIVANGTTFDVDGLAGHGHNHHIPIAGRNGFVLLANTRGALHSGETVTVVVGALHLDGVVLE